MSNNFKIDKSYKLSDREKAREKLDMFFGDKSNFIHPLMEAINNGIDEILNNFESGTLTCVLHDDLKTITVRDTGRGIPIFNEEEAETLLRTLFAGGKYDVTDNTTTGTFGCGLTATNYNSSLFECTSHMNGKIYHIKYIDGGHIEQELTCKGDTELHGTEITFRLDEDSFDNTIYNPEEIKLALRRFSQVSDKITIVFIHNEEEVVYRNGFEEYFDNYATDILGTPLYGSTKKYSRTVDVERKGKKEIAEEYLEIKAVLSTCTSESPLQETMLNGNYLKEHGTIYDGIIDGVKNYANKYCKDNKLYKSNEKPLNNNDVSSAIAFTCRVFNNLPSFGNQTKFYTKKEYYKEIAKKYIIEQLEIYKEENKKDFDRLIQQILICKRANETNEKAKQALKKKLTEKTDSINNRIEGFVDCEIEKGGELFLTEGLSALGSIVLARNSYNQAAYPLRGKLINVLKNSDDKIFKNEEIIDILNLLGTGIEYKSKFTKDLPKFDINNSRWNKIICTADADSDGKQINVLILTALYKLVPSLISSGYVYIAQSPLFEIKVSDNEKYYALSEAERDIKTRKLDLEGKKYEIHRLKGLGEVSKDVMYDTVCNKETRVLQQVKVEDVEEMINAFDVWMDKNVTSRKEYIEKNLHKYLIETPVEDITETKNIKKIIYDNMMEYSAETILDRAIPSIESGLKPSQAKTLWAMYTNKITKLTKSLNVTGAVTSYHEHGSVYPTIVNMCQEDRHIQPLIIGEGNFGNYTSKQLTAAADRYTNIKLSELSLDGLKEVDKKYVKMIPTYDGKKVMPLYIPSKYPTVLTQATNGMAVGMSSVMPSFNLNEICDAIEKYITTNKKTYLVPDFATYGYIENNDTVIKNLNENGQGTLKLRGKCIKENNSIIITEIPYGTFREDIVDKVISLAKEGKFKEITSIKDLTDLKGLKIKVECKKNTNLDLVIEKLYKLTGLENTYPCNMRVLYNGMPKVKGVWEIIDNWIEFRKECIKNGLNYECDKIKKELHLLYGIKNILGDINKAIEIIRFSKNYKSDLMNTFRIDEIQAEYILKLTLRDINKDFIESKISKVEKLESELNDKIDIINNNERLLFIILDDIKYVSNKFKTKRRTQILEQFSLNKTEAEDYNLNLVLSKEGYLKKVKLTSLRGNSEYRFKDGDKLSTIRQTSNKNDLLVFTNQQNCYKLKIHEIQDHKPSVLGLYLPSYLQLDKEEYIVDVIPTNYSEELLIAYENGKVARVPLSSYQTKTNRTKLSNATHSENIVGMHICEDTKYILATDDKALIFKSRNIPLKSSRNTQGITTIKYDDMGKVIKFKKVSDCKLDTQSRYIPNGNGKSGRKIFIKDEI